MWIESQRMKTQQLQLKFGKCPLCNETVMKIEKKEPLKLDNYDVFWMKLSDGSRMKVAICKDCKKSLTKKKVEDILSAHRVFWAEGIEKTMDAKIKELEAQKEQNINYYNNLNLVKHGLKEDDME